MPDRANLVASASVRHGVGETPFIAGVLESVRNPIDASPHIFGVAEAERPEHGAVQRGNLVGEPLNDRAGEVSAIPQTVKLMAAIKTRITTSHSTGSARPPSRSRPSRRTTWVMPM
jgi:hypothetical protein